MADFEATGDWSGAIAAAWEAHRDRLFERHRAVSEWLIMEIEPEPGQTILEISAGTGETGFLVAERLGPYGKLISTDLGPAMVEAARRGAEARRLANVECRVMDAQRLDLPDDSVDGVLSRFGIMLTPRPERAVTEARRVLHRGGRFAYAVWGPPDCNPWLTALVGAVGRNGYPRLANASGPGGLFSLAAPERNRDLLQNAGFSDRKSVVLDRRSARRGSRGHGRARGRTEFGSAPRRRRGAVRPLMFQPHDVRVGEPLRNQLVYTCDRLYRL